MREIYQIMCMDYENNRSKSISAYTDKQYAINMVSKLNAQCGELYGDPYYMHRKIIED